MSSFIELYVVDEKKLTTTPQGDDMERYERLVKEVRALGARWEEFEARGLFPALEAVDKHIGARKFLPIFAINNSPQNVLGNDAACPAFGYFAPDASSDLAQLLGKVPAATIDALDLQVPLSRRVYWAFREAAEEATRREHGLAILVDAPRFDAAR
jgi:hypothetical protein